MLLKWLVYQLVGFRLDDGDAVGVPCFTVGLWAGCW